MSNLKKVPFEKMLKLVDQLSPNEQSQLRRKLATKALGKDLRDLSKEIDEQNKDSSPISEEEILAEMKAIKKELRAKGARSRN